MDLLPDCRARTPTGQKWHPFFGWMVSVFCGNCHVAGPSVPEKNCSFAFWLCHKCEHLGTVAGTMAVPDDEFFQKVAEEQLESFGRYLSRQELTEVLKDDRSSLSRLAKDRT